LGGKRQVAECEDEADRVRISVRNANRRYGTVTTVLQSVVDEFLVCSGFDHRAIFDAISART
jgi:hypothetical protein